MRSLVSNASDIIFVVDADGLVRYVSPAIEKVLGHKPEQVVGTSLADHAHPDDTEALARSFAESLRDPEVVAPVRVRVQTTYGSWRFLEMIRNNRLGDSHVGGIVVSARDVTEWVRAEQELHALRREHEELLGSVDAVIWRGDAETLQFTFVSRQVEVILGYPVERWTDETSFWTDHIHPEDREWVVSFCKKATAEKRSHGFEYRMIAADGRVVWLQDTVNVSVEDGVPKQLFGVMVDVTERKEAEEALKKSEARFRAVFDKAATGMALVNTEGRVTQSNAALERMLGYRPEELIGMHFAEVTHPDDVAADTAFFERLMEGEIDHFRLEKRYLRKDGKIIWTRLTSSGVLSNGVKPRFMIGMVEDITERKEAEEALRQSEERFRSAFEDAPIGVAVVGLPSPSPATDRRYLKVNRALCEMLGYSEEELLSKISSEVTHPDDREKSRVQAERAIEEGASKYTIEKRYVRSDGRVVWALLNVSLVRDQEGNLSHFVSQLQDVTERKEAEEALRRSEASLAEAQRMAHLGSWEWDIRTGEAWWSDETYRIYGLVPGEVLPSLDKLLEVVLPEDRGPIKEAINRAVHEHEPYDIQHQVVRPDGEIRRVHRRAEIVRSERGEPLKMVGTVHDITEQKALEERLQHQAFHDLLTGLPNRQLLENRLGQALRRTRRGGKAAVLFMDIDDFKVVNDSLGHEAGDRLLVAVSERLKGCLRAEDTLARFGGDEFVVLLEDVEKPGDAVQAAERIVEGLREPFEANGRMLYIGTSIGIALGTAHQKSGEDLLRDADTAMYRAKAEGFSYRVFNPTMYERAVEHMELANDLRRAVEAEEFVVHYQPIIGFRSGEAWGVEALVRWKHPRRGLLNPSQFMPMAEESGLVISMGERVLEEACRQAKEWQEEHPRTPPLVMCVNLSARQLGRSDLAETVARVLKRTGLEARSLSLDITETIYIKALEANTVVLDNLKRMGVRIAIDDFGVGYSSLAYLKRLPADAIKVDKSFMAGLGEDIEDTAIVQTVIDLAHTLGMEVIAEGVESADRADQLGAMGSDMGQGFYFAKPLSPEAVSRFLMG